MSNTFRGLPKIPQDDSISAVCAHFRFFLEAIRRDRWERNLFRSSGPLSTIWRNEYRAPKEFEMRTRHFLSPQEPSFRVSEAHGQKERRLVVDWEANPEPL